MGAQWVHDRIEAGGKGWGQWVLDRTGTQDEDSHVHVRFYRGEKVYYVQDVFVREMKTNLYRLTVVG